MTSLHDLSFIAFLSSNCPIVPARIEEQTISAEQKAHGAPPETDLFPCIFLLPLYTLDGHCFLESDFFFHIWIYL